MHITCRQSQNHAHDDLAGRRGPLIQIAEAAPLPVLHVVEHDGRGGEVLEVFLIMLRQDKRISAGQATCSGQGPVEGRWVRVGRKRPSRGESDIWGNRGEIWGWSGGLPMPEGS